MEVRVRVPTPLRELVAGASMVSVDVMGRGDGASTVRGGRGDRGVTVGSALDALAADHPALERRVRDEQGQARMHVNLFVGADNIRDLDGLDTEIAPGQELSIIPAISGG